MEEHQAPLTPTRVYEAVKGALQMHPLERPKSEAQLREWERDAAPGFLDCLLQISSQPAHIDEDSRILAAVVAKNAVGSSWRKTLGSREWSRVGEPEKAAVRRLALGCLLQDPSERVAIQMTLLVANIARFDFPSKWPGLLAELTEAAAWEAPTPLAAKRRALRALKHVVRALRSKRIVAEAPRGANGRLSQEDLAPLAERIQQERQQLNRDVETAFLRAVEGWQRNMGPLLHGAEDWAARGACANQGLLIIREALLLLPSWDGLGPAVRQFLEAAHATATSTAGMVPPEDEASAGGVASRVVLGGKAFERTTQCVMAAMDRNPVDFAEYLPYFLLLYSNTALLGMDAEAVHRMRPKRRILLMRFLARALLCPVYQLDWFEMQVSAATEQTQKDELAAIWPKVSQADRALKELQAEPTCTRLVESIVTKYLALAPAELEEWEADPEQHVRAGDVEATPDAETPRPCGVALLLCMLSRGEGPVADALLKLAQRLQGQPRIPEVLLLQEACYRALGEAFSQLHKLPGIQFADWYSAELRGLLQMENQVEDVAGRALRSRAIWLVGICSGELPQAPWADATLAVMANLRHPDLVIALSAVAALAGVLGGLMEESEQVEADAMRSQLAESAANGESGGNIALESTKLPVASQTSERRAALDTKLGILEARAGELLTLALLLEGKLAEIESQVRVLQLVSIVVELLGDKAQPYLGIIADALPQVWESAAHASSSGKETGAVVRLHSALMGVLTHLVDRLGSLATSHPQVARILPPLLAHGLDLRSAESDTLAEDALRLLRATLSGSQGLQPQLTALVQPVMQILQRGRDNASALGVVEGFAILAGPELPGLLQPHLPVVAAAIQACVGAVATAAATAQSQPAVRSKGREDSRSSGGVAKETLGDAVAASSLSTLLLQLHVDPTVLTGALRSMAAVITGPSPPEPVALIAGGPRTLGGVVEGFLEVLTRVLFAQPHALSGLLSHAGGEARFLDRWLGIASRKYFAEVLGNPQAQTYGRLRRHMASACLCKLAATGASPALREPARAAAVLALAFRTLTERAAFQNDQRGMEEIIAQQESGADIVRDSILTRRLKLARLDPIRQQDTAAAAAAAAAAAVRSCPQAELREQLSFLGRDLPARLERLLGSGSDTASQIGGRQAGVPIRGQLQGGMKLES